MEHIITDVLRIAQGKTGLNSEVVLHAWGWGQDGVGVGVGVLRRDFFPFCN